MYLLQSRVGDAGAQYQKVIDRHPTSKGDLSSTQQQARRLCSALALGPADSVTVLAPFDLLST